MAQTFRNLDLAQAAGRMNLSTINLQDYEPMTPSIARVILTVTGRPDKQQLRASIAEHFKGFAAPIVNSFRELRTSLAARVLVGYVKTSAQVKEYEDTKGYKVMASNLLMDEADESLWELRKGTTGTYLVKHGEEDLSELATKLVQRRAGAPVMAQLACASTATREFASYVDFNTGEVEHGYVIETANGKVKLLPVEQNETVEIEETQLVEVVDLQGKDEQETGMRLATASVTSKALIEFYSQVFQMAPDYLAKLIDAINEHAVA